MKRFVFDIILLICVFTIPWWLSVGLAFIGLFVYKQFYEFLLAVFVIYGLYAIPGSLFIASPVWFPLIISFFYIVVELSRRYIIFYKNEI